MNFIEHKDTRRTGLSAVGRLQIYVHNVCCGSRKVRVLRPFVALGFMMMSLLCCLARYGLHHNHWPDVVVGFVVGVLLAVYIVSSLAFTSSTLSCSTQFIDHHRHFYSPINNRIVQVNNKNWHATRTGKSPT